MSLLETQVHVQGGARPFGELSHAHVAARAEELQAAVGFGPTQRVASVARAWAKLAASMQTAGAATVAEVDQTVLEALAEPLWIVPPKGSLLHG